MKKMIVLLLSVVMVFALSIPSFAAEPVEGSWIISEVYEIDEDGNRVLKTKEEAQSLYGEGMNILTFHEDGYGSDITFNAGDIYDVPATWEAAENGFEFMEDGLVLTFTYDEADLLHRSFTDDDPDAAYKNLDFVYTRAVVGSWKLDSVIQINEGDAPTDLPEEENASLYGNKDNILTFNADGTAVELVKAGPDEMEAAGTWTMSKPDVFVLTEDTIITELIYFRVDDTLYNDLSDGERTIRFTYARVDEEDTGDELPESDEEMPEEN